MMIAVESPVGNKILVFLCGFLVALNILVNASNLDSKEYEHDRINELPGQPKTTPKLSQFSGYITVNEEHGRALFYWFFEARSQPNAKPLVLWLNGGPGCSSVGYGAAVELGPLRPGKNGTALEFNQYSWNRESNLLFLESPVGVGFSYTNTSFDYTRMDDGFVAEDSYIFLVNWLKRFPQFRDHEFFISGESYAGTYGTWRNSHGHYVPQLAELVYDRNKNSNQYPYINLKGFIVGNPETNDYFDNKGILEYAWSHAVISDQDYNEAKLVCDFKKDDWSPECNKAMTVVFNRYKEIDMYNIYAPSCLLNKTSSVADDFGPSYGFGRMRLVPGGYDPCFSNYTAEYFNRKDVQKALRIEYRGLSESVKWTVCNDSLFKTYNYTVFSVFPIYRKLIKGGLKIWMYSGDADGRVPVIGTRYCIKALGLPLKTPWTSWFHRRQVAGRIIEYEGLTFVTIRGAGHLVPLNKPREALALIHSYLSGQHLPTHP